MKSIFGSQLEVARGPALPTASQIDYAVSLLRSILQYAAIAAYEKIDAAGDLDPHDQLTIIRLLRNPTESASTEVLSRLIPHLRDVVQPSFCSGWFEPLDGTSTPLSLIMQKWIASLRNGRSANVREKFSIIEHSLEVFADALPIVSETYDLKHDVNNYQFDSASLRLINNESVLIQRIRGRRGVWQVDYQTLNPYGSTEGTYSLPKESPLLTQVEAADSRFTTIRIPVFHTEPPMEIWEPDVLLPTRQTYHFQGRKDQLHELLEWYNNTERKMCLVRGDGGIGKTTLVLEFLHEILEHSTFDVRYFPEVICFYTAKLTMWTPDGFKRLNVTTGEPTIVDALMQLVSYVQTSPKKEWYALDVDSLIDQVAQELSEQGKTPANILLILDNTETLALQASKERELHRLLNFVSENIARVIVTSRRAEAIIAQHIVVPELDENSAVNLLGALAAEDSVAALKNANLNTLKRSAKLLNYKPLLLEVFVKHLTRPGVTIDSAIGKVQSSAGGSLGRFLYEDAWERLSEKSRKIFVVLSMIQRPLDHHTVGWACRELETLVTDWIDAYMETHFGSYNDYGAAGYDIVFVPEAVNFFQSQMGQFGTEDQKSLAAIVNKVAGLYDQMKAGESAYRPDRIDNAFRTPAAKAARLCANQNKLEEADTWYQEAISQEPKNSELFDRYAYFLTIYMKDYKRAAEVAREAIRCDGDNEEALYTTGCIEYRLSNLERGDSYMDRARNAGKPIQLCLMEKGRARVFVSDSIHPARERQSMLAQAMEFLTRAIEHLPNDRYYRETYNRCAKAYNRAYWKQWSTNRSGFPLSLK